MSCKRIVQVVEVLISCHTFRKLVHRCVAHLRGAGHFGAEQNGCCLLKQFSVIGQPDRS
jgi:hypothetical protein